jgi:hypothetical protein
MHLRRTFEDENGAGYSFFFIPLTLALSHPGEGIFAGIKLIDC